jgi:tRNA(Ile)-lysidine synthase
MVDEITKPDNLLFHSLMKQLLQGEAPTALAVAVSGGADSMALTLLLKDYCAAHYIALHALHVNHGLRVEAAREAQQVQHWLMQQNIACVVLAPTSPIDRMQGNLMHNARMVRYRLMQDYCATHDITYLCTAHHLHDQAETVLMRLGRGSGVDGLAGMREKARWADCTCCAPCFLITKKLWCVTYLI